MGRPLDSKEVGDCQRLTRLPKLIFVFVCAVCLWCGVSKAQAKTEYINDIYYMCADWGPDGDTIFFVKQILFKKKTTGLFTGDSGQIEPLGGRLWFCKMKWDGTGKEEICELWPGQNAFVDINGNAMWMDVCRATKQAAFSIQYGNVVGIWVIDLDGKNLHRPFEPIWNDKEKWAPVHPSWSPGGSRFIFCEINRTTSDPYLPARLVVCQAKTGERKVITTGPRDEHPVWSPKGDWIAYTHYLQFDSWKALRRIWLIKPNGSEAHPILDQNGKDIFGWWPSWSPDASRISFSNWGLWVAGVATNSVSVLNKEKESPSSYTNHHWGRRGWLESYGYSIRFCERDPSEANLVASSTSITVLKPNDLSTDQACWGSSNISVQEKSGSEPNRKQ